MKKLVLMLVVTLGFMTVVNAQTVPFKDYVGKYIFAAGSPVAEVTLTAEDTTLVINSAMGSTTLEKKGTDTFYLAQYDALVIFKRAADKTVESVSIAVQGMDLIGKKESGASLTGLKEEEFQLQIWADKVNY
jgi:ABC-type Na+ efflux pump permease subunit